MSFSPGSRYRQQSACGRDQGWQGVFHRPTVLR